MRKILLSLVVVVAGVVLAAQQSEGQGDPKVGDFMQVKLTHSKNVLEGLAIEDYDLIAKNAQDLALLSQAASWNVLQTEDYLQHSKEFRRSAHAIKKAAEDKNLDGATLAYMQMTMSCVRCHQYVRSTDQ